MPHILLLLGLPDNNEVQAVLKGGRLGYVTLGCANIGSALRSTFHTDELILLGQAPDHTINCATKPDVIVNQISEADTHDISLTRAEELCQRFQVPVINPPELIRLTCRDRVSRALADKPGLIVPSTIRCQLTAPDQVAEEAERHSLEYPLLVRAAGSHAGKMMVKVNSKNDVSPFHALPLDGRDFYLTEFVDFRSEDGLYRKCRIVVVQGKVFLKHWMIHDDWSVHADDSELMSQREVLRQEEEDVLRRFDQDIGPKLEAVVSELYAIVGLDFFGVDGNITADGKLLVFECNANMNLMANIRSSATGVNVQIKRIAHALVEMVQSKMM